MEDQEFQTRAGQALENLNLKLGAAADRFEFDSDLNGGALVIEFEDPRERFVVSPNSPVQQIWVSAHVRSYKLDWDAARNAFVHAQSGESLEELIGLAVRKRIPDFDY
ncbi:MAG TPA: iron donor protein CyaY [Bryobacteraceae bacterium]|nr:iron donor protein CyaY [Bryobacteraceae bacterium]HPT25057.1 iron donor protein CyaY [Bryobacteraceae bacterium]